MSSAMTLRLDEYIKARLDELAGATQRRKWLLVAQAIRESVGSNEQQVGKIARSRSCSRRPPPATSRTTRK